MKRVGVRQTWLTARRLRHSLRIMVLAIFVVWEIANRIIMIARIRREGIKFLK